MGVDLARVEGTGSGGAITKADVERAATQAVGAAPAPDAALAMRHAVAAAVSLSKRELPHYYLAADINLGKALAWLATQNQTRSVVDRILAAALLLKSVAVALFPQ
jgi:pyruvate dehydrogenase E2 component (dihydrolipoyllysine-residue acetyltransferase)